MLHLQRSLTVGSPSHAWPHFTFPLVNIHMSSLSPTHLQVQHPSEEKTVNKTLQFSVYPVNMQAHRVLSTPALVKLPEKEDAGLQMIDTKSRNGHP